MVGGGVLLEEFFAKALYLSPQSFEILSRERALAGLLYIALCAVSAVKRFLVHLTRRWLCHRSELLLLGQVLADLLTLALAVLVVLLGAGAGLIRTGDAGDEGGGGDGDRGNDCDQGGLHGAFSLVPACCWLVWAFDPVRFSPEWSSGPVRS